MTKSQTLNPLSHPGTPEKGFFFSKSSLKFDVPRNYVMLTTHNSGDIVENASSEHAALWHFRSSVYLVGLHPPDTAPDACHSCPWDLTQGEEAQCRPWRAGRCFNLQRCDRIHRIASACFLHLFSSSFTWGNPVSLQVLLYLKLFGN